MVVRCKPAEQGVSGRPGRNCRGKGLPRARVGQLSTVRTSGEDEFLQFVRLIAQAQCGAKPGFRIVQAVGTAHDTKKNQAPVFEAQVGVAPEHAKVVAVEHALVRLVDVCRLGIGTRLPERSVRAGATFLEK